jgi:hypothetical protein
VALCESFVKLCVTIKFEFLLFLHGLPRFVKFQFKRMKILHYTVLFVSVIIFWNNTTSAQDAKPKYDVFSFQQQITLPGTTTQIYDAMTGDISGWWDHSFSEKPYKLYIDAIPGGGFYEIFNAGGDGAKHATVILSDRGKILRYDGPLGLSGKAIQMVTTYEYFEKGADSTTVKVSVHGAGEVEEGMPAKIESVWHHFLFERLKPYVEAAKR